MTRVSTSIRIDADLKQAASKQLASMGLSMNTYLNMALRQLVLQQAVQFESDEPSWVPNEETEKALVLARAEELGLIPDNAPAFDDPKRAIRYLNDEQ